ncbi:hypothetical protein FKM82_021706 [Ascaphus truei]
MAQAVEVAFSDFQSKNNNHLHHTQEISDRRLIIRRGQPFSIILHFKTGAFHQGKDNIVFITETGPWPDESSGTKVIFPLTKGLNKKTWTATVETNGPDSMVIAIIPSANAIIGRYTLKIQVTTGNKTASYQLGEFILLFNPWCADDDVYLGDDAQRNEYVINDYGLIYQGNAKHIKPSPWNLGQFQDDIVDICLKMLDKNVKFLKDAFKDLSHRNDPVYVSRIVCAMVNSDDDNGVVLGKWDGDFERGVCPSTWNGSVAILRQWYKSDCNPVMYGQCWVFAAVMCTVMRCLGIPSRIVTNFNSAHDTDTDLIIDQLYDSTGKTISKDGSDSIWNFHVWCECWMARKDLPQGYGGWQVLDPTPQEESEGIYCCGPASVKAIKEGEIQLGYDSPFVFAMVNADCHSWTVNGARQEKHFCDPHLIGKCISTKSVGSDEREDVTHQYKYEEGTTEERKVLQKAISRLRYKDQRISSNGDLHSNGTNGISSSNGVLHERDMPAVNGNYDKDLSHNRPLRDAQLILKFKLTESPQLGQTINVVLLAGNLVSNPKTLKLNLSAQSMKHNGKPGQQFWRESMYIELGPTEEKWILLGIPYAQYGKSLEENNLVRVTAIGEQNATWEKLLVHKDINLALPDIDINFLGPVLMNKPCKVQLTICNPFDEQIQNCVLLIEGSGLVKAQIGLKVGNMGPKERATVQLEIVPYKSGLKQLQVNLSSSKLQVIKGFQSVMVKP